MSEHTTETHAEQGERAARTDVRRANEKSPLATLVDAAEHILAWEICGDDTNLGLCLAIAEQARQEGLSHAEMGDRLYSRLSAATISAKLELERIRNLVAAREEGMGVDRDSSVD